MLPPTPSEESSLHPPPSRSAVCPVGTRTGPGLGYNFGVKHLRQRYLCTTQEKLNVRFMVPKRHHKDEHYCSAVIRYMLLSSGNVVHSCALMISIASGLENQDTPVAVAERGKGVLV